MDNRTTNTKRNLISGSIMQILNMLLPFASRTIVFYLLGAEYQGISGLFSSILQVLNLADLGFSTAVIYVLYQPIADRNLNLIRAVLAYLKKCYFVVGCVILGVGLLILPFLSFLISGSYPDDINIYVLFIIYLINTASSYMLFSYKNALFNAMQRTDLSNNVASISNLLVRLLQILLLLFFKSYYIYVIVLPFTTILSNLLISFVSRKYYPEYEPEGELDKRVKKTINKQIKAIFIDRIGDVARNAFDNIVISSVLGLTMVAIYDNYFYIFTTLYGFIAIIRKSMQGSVGNSIVTDTKDKNYSDFRKFTFILMWLVSWATTCLLCLYQPFMMIWMNGNSEMILSNGDMTLFCLYFYFINMSHTRNLYLEGDGLFWECRIWYIVEAFSNLFLNFILGYLFRVTGILLATIVTILLFNFIARTNVLFKHYFFLSSKEFYVIHLKCFITCVLSSLLTYICCSFVTLNYIYTFLISALICVFLPNIVFVLLNFKNPLLHETFSWIQKIINIPSYKR